MRPFCLVESHIVKTLDKAGVLCFTSYTFCNIELAVMINLHKRDLIKVLINCLPCKVQSVLIILVGENQTAEGAREVFTVFLRVALRFAKRKICF